MLVAANFTQVSKSAWGWCSGDIDFYIKLHNCTFQNSTSSPSTISTDTPASTAFRDSLTPMISNHSIVSQGAVAVFFPCDNGGAGFPQHNFELEIDDCTFESCKSDLKKGFKCRHAMGGGCLSIHLPTIQDSKAAILNSIFRDCR